MRIKRGSVCEVRLAGSVQINSQPLMIHNLELSKKWLQKGQPKNVIEL